MDGVKRELNEEQRQQIITQQQQGGNPFKLSFIISIIAFWNLSFIYDYIVERSFPIGKGTITALVGVLALGAMLLFSKSFGSIILKNDREVKEVKSFVYFLMFIFTAMLSISILYSLL